MIDLPSPEKLNFRIYPDSSVRRLRLRLLWVIYSSSQLLFLSSRKDSSGRFSLGSRIFVSSRKPTLLNSNSIWDRIMRATGFSVVRM